MVGSRLKFHRWSGAVAIVVLGLVLGETFVESQYYFHENGNPPPGPGVGPNLPTRGEYYYYDDKSFFPGGYGEAEARGFSGGLGRKRSPPPPTSPHMFAERRGRVDSGSDEDDEEDDDMQRSASKISVSLPAGRPRPVKLPKGFNDRVNKRMKMSRRSKTRLHGDPDPIDEEDEEGRKPEGRLLWPFSIEITKGQKDKGGGGWGGPGGYGSYHEWLAQNGWGWGGGHGGGHGGGGGGGGPGWGGWGPIQGPWGSWGEHGSASHDKHPYGWKPGDLTDEEILNSKHYKKYRKKKKKKIKKLKKKLKFKRLVQKILQKHITYLDKIAPY